MYNNIKNGEIEKWIIGRKDERNRNVVCKMGGLKYIKLILKLKIDIFEDIKKIIRNNIIK